MSGNELFVTQLLTQASAGFGVATALSWLLEKIPAWSAIDPAKKKLYYFLMCATVALLAKVALDTAPQALLASIDPYIKIIFNLIVVWTGGTAFYVSGKASQEIKGLRSANRSLEEANRSLDRRMRGMEETAIREIGNSPNVR